MKGILAKEHFYDVTKAREYLEHMRWPTGVVCPHCSSLDAYKLEPKANSKSHVRDGVYKCKACRGQFTVTVGTIYVSHDQSPHERPCVNPTKVGYRTIEMIPEEEFKRKAQFEPETLAPNQ